MKKSTLITTIAMIVVVVVALSTATYAWFSSSQKTTVQANMTTTAQAGWLVSGGTVANNAGTATVTYTATEPELHMYDGLYAPIGAITGTLSNAANGASGTFVENKFHTAKQTGTGLATTAKSDTSDGAYVYQVSTVDYSNLNVVRVTNNNTNAAGADLELTIYVYVNQETPTNAQLLAAKSFSTYIAASSGDEFNTEYYYTATTAFVGPGADTKYTASYGGHVNVSDDGAAQDPTPTITYSEDLSHNTVKTPSVGISAGFLTASSTILAGVAALTDGAAYYSMTIDLGHVNQSATIDLVFYAWFDGWALDDTASGGTVNVLYSFATAD